MGKGYAELLAEGEARVCHENTRHDERRYLDVLCRNSPAPRLPANLLVPAGSVGPNVNTRWPDHRAVFAQYAEHTKSKQWTQARLVGSQARLVIALGFTAEYGLVRLFADLGMRVRDSVTKQLWREPRLRAPDNWTYSYPGGSRDRSLAKRYDPPCWWQIEDPTGRPRWALVPVVHPSSWGSDLA